MVRKTIGLVILSFWANLSLLAQELYVFTEPASNMPAQSIGVRITNEGMFPAGSFKSRSIAEVMVGLNKSVMFHVQGFVSDMDGRYQLEGASFYLKYRFLSLDNAQSHFRGAAFGRVSSSRRKFASEDINLEGDNSGFQGGLVFTQLIHKLALSSTIGYSKSLGTRTALTNPNEIISYSLSSGYLLLPFVYKNYNQPNFNLYFEMLGRSNPVNGKSTLDFAPALQVILDSKTRIDLGYRFNVAGNIENAYLKNMYLARVEFNFFNALSKKQ
ncbi:hypothetical protein [Pedobacter insulae]|uniref:MetA-pathway of phenol degradation n=1 Tax=Pedobacter insulae TaxID=414048 RepID=A0A1I2XE23_9SPHI|nr:hypothetical protein [Pedobacter insulae]SFH11297.1 hypothetical protein SAMN04489864_105153 [Pedobacter insulae]